MKLVTLSDVPRKNGPPNSNPALGCPPNTFEGEGLYEDVKANMYDTTFTFSGPGTYVIRYTDPFRREDIVNMKDPGNQHFFVETEITVLSTTNHTPTFLNLPIGEACVNTIWTHNPGVYDADGDSLAFEMVDCQQYNPAGGITMPRVCTNYLFPDNNFFGSSSLSINSQTGFITWDAPRQIGVYAIAFEVVSFRKGVPVGRMIRDMVIFVNAGCMREIAMIEAPNEVCAPALETTELRFLAYQNIRFDSLYLDFNDGLKGDNGPFQTSNLPVLMGEIIESGNPTGTFTTLPVGTDNRGFLSDTIKATLSWVPDCEDIRAQFYAMDLIAYDNEGNRTTPKSQLKAHHVTRIQVLPPTPDSLVLVHNQFGILLDWSPNSCTNVSGYRVYRKINPGSWPVDPTCCRKPQAGGYTRIATVSGRNTSRFVDNPVGLNGEEVCYVVTTVYGGFGETKVESCVSEEVCELNFTTAIESAGTSLLQVYPNPATGFLICEGISTPVEEVLVFDMTGKKILLPLHQEGERIKIETEALESGMYGLQIWDNGVWRVGRFVKE